ncbi:MAG TPA: ABC transporter substrate-binding protein [Candidatus Limnocylindria bacterium]|nr:ABC transporter substrate-binding protein [Candidatus Limnocylindria bacterium]
MKTKSLILTAIALFCAAELALAADKLRVAYVSPSVSQSLPWIAKELGILAKHDLAVENLLITGSPRLVQALIAGDVDVIFAGVTAMTRARMRGADVAILGASANLSSQKLMVSRTSKIRRLEEVKGAVIGVSQYGSEADTFARNALAKVGLKPDKDVTIIQLGGHPQVAAALAAGKLEAGILGGLAILTAERSGARFITSAADLKILSPSGTFATTRGYIQRKRSVVERLTRSFVEAIHYLKTNRSGAIVLLQRYLGGLSADEASYLYDEQVEFLERIPGPNEKALAAVLERESDPKVKSLAIGDFIDPSFFREIEKSGLIEQLYRK